MTASERKRLLRLIERAVEERAYLLRISDVMGYAVGFREKDGRATDEPVLSVYVRRGRKDQDPAKLPKHQRIPRRIRLYVDDAWIWLGVDLVETEMGRLRVQSGAMPALISGRSIGNQNVSNNTGTIGWIAERQDTGTPVLCSDFHVLLSFGQSVFERNGVDLIYRHDNAHTEFITSPSLQDGGDRNLDFIGQVARGLRSQLVDVAIVDLLGGRRSAAFIDQLGPMGRHRFIRSTEIRPETNNPIQVSLTGRSSGRQEGIITRYPARFLFDYPDRRPSGLLMLDLIEARIQTTGGDSGALLVDENTRPLGMLVGGVGSRSFFMHIRNIIQTMKLRSLVAT